MADGCVVVKNFSTAESGIDIYYGSGQTIGGIRVFDANGVAILSVNPTGSFNVKSFLASLVAVNNAASPYAVLGTDFYLPVDASGGAVAITLFAVSAANGAVSRPIIVQKTDSSVNAVTINRAGADTIDGQTAIILQSQFATAFLTTQATGKWGALHTSVPDLHNLKTISSTPYNVTYSDNKILFDATGGAITVNLPAASSVPAGWEFRAEKIDVSANAVTVTRAGADTIEGANTVALAAQYNNTRVTSDGVSKWYKF